MFLLLAMGAVIALCTLLWRVAVYALPVFVGFTVGWWALKLDAGIGSIVAGSVAGVATFTFGRIGARAPSPMVRYAAVALFAIPAAYAGYHIVLDLGTAGTASPVWQHVLAAVGAVAVGGTAAIRLAKPAADRSADGR